MEIRMLVGVNAGQVVELDDESADNIVMRGKGLYLDSDGEESESMDDGLDDNVDLPDVQ